MDKVESRMRVAELILLTLVFAATAFAACYTKKQWQTASDHEWRSLRAYVGVVIPQDIAKHSMVPPATPNFSIAMKNFGQTPAYNVTQRTGFAIEKYPLPDDFGFAFRPEQIRPVPVTIFPGAINGEGSEFPFPRPLTPDEASRIQGGRNWRLYIYGTLNYYDAFNKFHYTDFCVSFFIRDSRTNVYEECEPHNNSD